jgi:hypothetical protein
MMQAGEVESSVKLSYVVRFLPIGPEDAEVGPPTQMAVFTLRGPDDIQAADQ